MKELGLDGSTETEDKLTYAKQQLGVKSSECVLLGFKWNKLTDQSVSTFQQRSLSLLRESGLKAFCYHGRHCGGQGSNINRHGALARARRGVAGW